MPGRQAVALCDSALKVEAPGRAGFLKEACAGDEALRREVESLLACEERAERFLTSPALEMLTAPGAPGEPEQLPAGLEIGPYRIVAHLGGGGMGQVYRARDTRLERDVALKFLPAASAQDPEALKRFQREARAASALNHPSICTLHDIGGHEGQPFLVMELLEGQSLKERLQTGPLSCGEVVDLALQITDALEAAHAKSIVHRDIKPANIFITGRGQAKILDFGLAKLLSEPRAAAEGAPGEGPLPAGEETITRAGTALGTVAYMSPEQARGETADARSDLFSLGATLYQMATGRLPFQEGIAELTREAILRKDPVRPREVKPDLPLELERIVLKALEKDRAQRYQSAAELHADLEQLRPRPRAARWPLAVGAAVVAGAVTLVVGVRSGWFGEPPARTLELTPRQVTANPAEDPAIHAAISPDGQYLAYADLSGIHVRRIDTGETRSIPPPPGHCFR